MSGFEVAGVLLAVIPLVVSALQSYKTTKQRYLWFASKGPYVDQLIQSLNEQIFFIKADVGLALRATDLEQERINAFLEDPDLKLLCNPEIAEAVQDYLGDGFQLYVDALAGCQRIVCEIVKSLNGLVPESKIQSNDLPSILRANPKKNGSFEFTRKIKFALKKDDLDAQIKELNRATKTLSRIKDQSMRGDVVAVQSASRAITKLTSVLSMVRETADRLHSAISLGYADGCHDQHEATLFLQTRSDLVHGSQKSSLKKLPLSFEVAFLPAPFALDNAGWAYKAEVKVVEGDDDHNDGETTTPKSPASPNQPVVTFSLPPSPSTRSPSLDAIEDLCSLVHSAGSSRELSCIFLSRKGTLCSREGWMSTLKHKSSPLPLGDGAITLKQIFATANPDIPGLPLNQRIGLSYNMASSVMQLHSTPWLALPLTSASVCFRSAEIVGVKRQSLYGNQQQPFIKAVFADCASRCNESHYSTRHAMLELGILLLELWHAQSIESYAVDNGLKMDESFGARYEVAQDWILQSEGDMMPFYQEAATRCIECTFATSSSRPDWSDLTFQKSVCQYVLKPLLENCPARFR